MPFSCRKPKHPKQTCLFKVAFLLLSSYYTRLMERMPPGTVRPENRFGSLSFSYLMNDLVKLLGPPLVFRALWTFPFISIYLYKHIIYTYLKHILHQRRSLLPWFSATHRGASPRYPETKCSGPLAVKTTAGDVTVSFLWWEKTCGVFVWRRQLESAGHIDDFFGFYKSPVIGLMHQNEWLPNVPSGNPFFKSTHLVIQMIVLGYSFHINIFDDCSQVLHNAYDGDKVTSPISNITAKRRRHLGSWR